jgi:hypothetical protein
MDPIPRFSWAGHAILMKRVFQATDRKTVYSNCLPLAYAKVYDPGLTIPDAPKV